MPHDNSPRVSDPFTFSHRPADPSVVDHEAVKHEGTRDGLLPCQVAAALETARRRFDAFERWANRHGGLLPAHVAHERAFMVTVMAALQAVPPAPLSLKTHAGALQRIREIVEGDLDGTVHFAPTASGVSLALTDCHPVVQDFAGELEADTYVDLLAALEEALERAHEEDSTTADKAWRFQVYGEEGR